MKAIEILNRCRDGAGEVERMQHRLERLKECAADSAVIRADVAQCQLDLGRRTRELDAERLAACRIVDMLPDPECGILYRYFVSGQSQGGIVTALRITVGYYKRKKREALAIADQMDEQLVASLLPAWYLEGKP